MGVSGICEPHRQAANSPQSPGAAPVSVCHSGRLRRSLLRIRTKSLQAWLVWSGGGGKSNAKQIW